MPGFESFLVMVLNDAALRDELVSAPDLPALFARVRELARERGLELSDQELQNAVNANRRSWMARWVDA